MEEFWKGIGTQDRVDIEKLIEEIRTHGRADTSFALIKGVEIAKWKERIKHGDFLTFLEGKAGIQRRKAQRWMKASLAFEGQFEKAALLPRQAIYHLSSDDVWIAPVRKKVLDELTPDRIPSIEQIQKACSEARVRHVKIHGVTPRQKDPVREKRVAVAANKLFGLLKADKQAVVGILNGEDWNLVRKALVKLLSSSK